MPDDAWNEFCLVAHKLKFTNIDIFSCKIDETRKAQIERIVRQNVLRESVSMEEGGLKSLIFHSMFQQGASKLKTVFYNNRKNLPEELRARLKIGY
jgi:hypothetical protein